MPCCYLGCPQLPGTLRVQSASEWVLAMAEITESRSAEKRPARAREPITRVPLAQAAESQCRYTTLLRRSCAPSALNRSSASHQVDNQNDHRDNEQDMDEAAGHVEAPTEQPQDQENCKNRPKHRVTLARGELATRCERLWTHCELSRQTRVARGISPCSRHPKSELHEQPLRSFQPSPDLARQFTDRLKLRTCFDRHRRILHRQLCREQDARDRATKFRPQ
jgi:hypothetical protein